MQGNDLNGDLKNAFRDSDVNPPPKEQEHQFAWTAEILLRLVKRTETNGNEIEDIKRKLDKKTLTSSVYFDILRFAMYTSVTLGGLSTAIYYGIGWFAH